MLRNANGASAGESVRADAGPAIIRSLSPAMTRLLMALKPLVAGVALQLEVRKTAEIDSRAIERAICRAQARVELFCCSCIELFSFDHFSCRSFFPRLPLRRFTVTLGKVKSLASQSV